jgi:Ca2+-binding RTX toxin-like protein
MRLKLLPAVVAAGLLVPAGSAAANTSHAGWPDITGVLLMNKLDRDRPLDARPGADPFGGADASYSCDGIHSSRACVTFHRGRSRRTARLRRTGHNELLGGHGNDTIHAGQQGDVLWGDYKPSGQPTSQTDQLWGGPGNDFIYASHGRNVIHTRGGRDVVHAHFGRGEIHCESSRVTVFLSRRSRPGYRLTGRCHVSYKTLGY